MERDLAAGDIDAYEIDLLADQYLYATFEQRGIDVVVRVFGPGRARLFEVDRPYGTEGAEKVHLVAAVSGRYLLEVSCPRCAPPGHYLVRVHARRAATAEDRHWAAAERAFYEARGWNGRHPEIWEAIAKLEQALRLFQRLGAKDWQAEALYRLGKLRLEQSDYGEALDLFQSANALYRELGDRLFIALSYNQIGYTYAEWGRFDLALPAYLQAMAEWRRQRPRLAAGHAVTLANLGELYALQGKATEALRYYKQAAEVWRLRRDPDRQASALTHVGWLYRTTGNRDLALAALREALALPKGTALQRAALLNEMGMVLLDADEPRRALAWLEQARQLESNRGDSDVVATTLTDLGICYRRLQEPAKAVTVYDQAIGLLHKAGNRRAEASAWLDLGTAYLHLQQPRAAACYRRALGLARETAYRAAEALARLGLAAAARDRGNLGEAVKQGEAAVEIVEALRAEVSRPDLQATYLALHEDYYGLLIGVLMQMHGVEPGRGFDLRALRLSEQSRARSLLDDLVARRAATAGSHPLDAALVAERRRLLERIAAKDRELRTLVDPPQPDTVQASRTGVEDELLPLQERLREVADLIRRGEPRPALPNGTPPRSVADIHQGLLDDQTLLLEYRVAPAKSYLWAVTASSAASFELPGGDRLEPLVRSLHAAWSRGPQQSDQERAAASQAAQLSHVLLGQVADRLGEHRLLIVADGALRTLPFAALPDPRQEETPLMVRHEIVYAPSLAVLAELRAAGQQRPPAAGAGAGAVSGAVAILADPVLSNADERARGFAPLPSQLDPLLGSLPRLPYARVEADAIAALAGKHEALEALGFDASRELVTSGRLRRYPILHFATHGLLRDDPDLSGLALSQLDRSGRPRDGLLTASEIKLMDLAVDLVVLSACKTALGKELGGEGLVGLPQSFLSAGARRVLVSLWDIGDRSTSELMRHFYYGLLVSRRSPAAALRGAQLAMWRDVQTRAPYSWGAFVLQGDWR